jgi:hypothetical protein
MVLRNGEIEIWISSLENPIVHQLKVSALAMNPVMSKVSAPGKTDVLACLTS